MTQDCLCVLRIVFAYTGQFFFSLKREGTLIKFTQFFSSTFSCYYIFSDTQFKSDLLDLTLNGYPLKVFLRKKIFVDTFWLFKVLYF